MGTIASQKKNKDYIKSGCEFFQKDNVHCFNKDFRKLKVDKIKNSDFVYFDPPYLNTTATYTENGGWNDTDEEDLYSLCEELDSKRIKFGLSNVFKCKGNTNKHLMQWCDNRKWNIYTFDKFTYMACGRGNANAQEVYIRNY